VARHRSIDELRRRRHLLFSEIEPFPDGVDTPALPPFPTQIGQTTLRNVLGQSELDELLAERNKINRDLQAIIDEHI
jgi:regulator of protease activity HflC (stomatin/prohibitin superfamily)